jgi:hypothetical protein
MPTQEKTQQTPALDTETITVTEAITVTETITEAMPAASTGPITVVEEISVTAPVTTTGIITLTEAASDTVAAVFAEKAAVELTALDAWTELDSGIELFSPMEDGAYRSPIEIIGLANTQGGIVNLRLLDQDGQILAWRAGMDAPQEGFDFFHTSLRFNVEEETEAALRISETSVADGAQLQQVEIPLVLLPGQRSIDVRLPPVGSIVCGEIPIAGYSDTSQARVVIELRTPDGEIVGTADTIGGHHGDYREFFALLDPEANEPQALLVSASASDPDGENGQLDETVVPITLYPAETKGCP